MGCSCSSQGEPTHASLSKRRNQNTTTPAGTIPAIRSKEAQGVILRPADRATPFPLAVVHIDLLIPVDGVQLNNYYMMETLTLEACRSCMILPLLPLYL